MASNKRNREKATTNDGNTTPTKKRKTASRVPLLLTQFVRADDDGEFAVCIIHEHRPHHTRMFMGRDPAFSYTATDRTHEGPEEKSTGLMLEAIRAELRTGLPDEMYFRIYGNYAGEVLYMKWKDRAYAYQAMTLVLAHAPGLLTQTRYSASVDAAYIHAKHQGILTPASLESQIIENYKDSVLFDIKHRKLINGSFQPAHLSFINGSFLFKKENAWITQEGKRLSHTVKVLDHAGHIEDADLMELSSDEMCEEDEEWETMLRKEEIVRAVL